MIVACDRNGAIGKDGDLPYDNQPTCNISNVSQWIQPSSWEEKTWDSLPDYAWQKAFRTIKG